MRTNSGRRSRRIFDGKVGRGGRQERSIKKNKIGGNERKKERRKGRKKVRDASACVYEINATIAVLIIPDRTGKTLLLQFPFRCEQS